MTNAPTGFDLAWDEAGMLKETIVGTGDSAGNEFRDRNYIPRKGKFVGFQKQRVIRCIT